MNRPGGGCVLDDEGSGGQGGVGGGGRGEGACWRCFVCKERVRGGSRFLKVFIFIFTNSTSQNIDSVLFQL